MLRPVSPASEAASERAASSLRPPRYTAPAAGETESPGEGRGGEEESRADSRRRRR